MTTISTLITAAFREGNLIPVGTSPTTGEQTEALDLLNRTVTNVLALEKSANFFDFVADSSIVATTQLYKHTRIVRNGAAVTLKFPNPVDDGARMQVIQGPINTGALVLSGNGYTIDGATTVTYSSGVSLTPVLWFFRGDVGDWKTVAPQLVADDFLFPPEFDDLFITMLFVRLAPRYGKQVAPASAAVIEAGMDAFVARFFQGARLTVAKTNQKEPGQ